MFCRFVNNGNRQQCYDVISQAFSITKCSLSRRQNRRIVAERRSSTRWASDPAVMFASRHALSKPRFPSCLRTPTHVRFRREDTRRQLPAIWRCGFYTPKLAFATEYFDARALNIDSARVYHLYGACDLGNSKLGCRSRPMTRRKFVSPRCHFNLITIRKPFHGALGQMGMVFSA